MQVRWTAQAVSDLTGISDYIEQRTSPFAARSVALAIYKSAENLRTFPQRGRQGRAPGTRELLVSRLPYVIVYRLRENAVDLLRILHGAQDQPG